MRKRKGNRQFAGIAKKIQKSMTTKVEKTNHPEVQ